MTDEGAQRHGKMDLARAWQLIATRRTKGPPQNRMLEFLQPYEY
jgi:hypothetical protein